MKKAKTIRYIIDEIMETYKNHTDPVRKLTDKEWKERKEKGLIY